MAATLRTVRGIRSNVIATNSTSVVSRRRTHERCLLKPLGVRVQCGQIQFQMQIPRVGTKNVLCLSVQVRIVAAGSLSQTVCRNDFLISIGADFRNLNLPALYAYPKELPLLAA